ncbi:MAG: D-glycerate dehydrogenase [Chloroflexi bacterium]|nr:D-glycerate dehydrogenase [Chloroflexota bacterium]
MKVLVVMPNGPEEAYAPIVEAGHEVAFGVSGDTRFVRMPDDELIALAGGASCLVFNVASRHVLESLPGLATLVSPYVGFDKIDVEAATEAGILVCNTVSPLTPVANSEAAVTLLLALAKRLVRRSARLRRGGWTDDADAAVLLSGSTVGIVGLGRIGSGVARRLAGWDVRLLAHTRTPHPELMAELGVEPVDLPTLLRESDFVTLHVSLNPQTEGMIGEAELRAMKPTASLINTSRGLVVDEDALVRAIRDDWIAGAALDAYVREPLPSDNPLRDLDPERVILTPHAMSGTETMRRRTKSLIIETVLASLRGEVPDLALNPEVLPRWRGRAQA